MIKNVTFAEKNLKKKALMIKLWIIVIVQGKAEVPQKVYVIQNKVPLKKFPLYFPMDQILIIMLS